MTIEQDRALVELVNRLVGGYLGNVRRGPGLCSTCLRPVESSYLECYRCHSPQLGANAIGPLKLADQVALLAYGGDTGQSRQLLYGYKEPTAAAPGDERRMVVLLLLLAAFRLHRPCLEAGSPFRYFAVVPSTKARAGHPLAELVRQWLAAAGLVEVSLVPTGQSPGRVIDPTKFAAPPIDGGHVLLIDDTWTTGANVQSAAWRLKISGATKVTALVVARWLDDSPATRAFLKAHPNVGYDPRACPAPRGHIPG